MKRNTWLFAGVLILVGVIAVPMLYGERHPAGVFGEAGRHDGSGPLKKLRWIARQLNLTDDQAAQLRNIGVGVRDENREYRDQIRSNMIEAAQALIEKPDDMAAARAILARNAEAEAAIKANVLKGISSGLQILTPEQRTKLAGILEQHRQRF